MDSNSEALEHLRVMLASGCYGPGSKLPAERQIATELQLSRAAVRRALLQLEDEGKVWRHVGQGTFVGPKPTGDDSVALLGHRTSPKEIMDLLRILEPNTAYLAALHASDSDFEQMESCVTQCEGADSPDMYEARDAALHSAVARATRNSLLMAVHTTVNAARLEASWGRLREAAISPDRQKVYCDQHRRVVDAIQARSPKNAAAEMARHIDTVRQNLLIRDEFLDC